MEVCDIVTNSFSMENEQCPKHKIMIYGTYNDCLNDCSLFHTLQLSNNDSQNQNLKSGKIILNIHFHTNSC